MRFDDMIATVLAREPERPSARIALWRQLLDLLAQHRGGEDREIARGAFDRVVAMRGEIPVAVRREAAAAIAGRPVSPAMVALIASDVPTVAGAMLSRVRLPEAEWLGLLPGLSPVARSLLRHRRDLGTTVAVALASFGTADHALGGGVSEARDDDGATTRPARSGPRTIAPPMPPHDDEPELPLGAVDGNEPFEPGTGEGQIRAIISRIARFRSVREEGGEIAPPVAPPADTFLFETGVDGVIRWVEGVPRGALIGETIATPSSGGYGVDAQAPGAFRRRGPFRDARLLVAGGGAAAGEWRIAAVPVFATATGRFLGYRGSARRPRADERAEPAATLVVAGAAPASADSLRQLVHELRTPLNAIGGFAEMIRRQMRGPVAEPYRDRAGQIADQAGQLLTAVDDLDVSARLDSARLDLQRLPIDVAPLLAPVCAELAAAAAARGASLDSAIPDGLPAAVGDPAAIRRMTTRLLSAATGLALPGEAIRLTLDQPMPGGLAIHVTRPARLAGVADAALFDPGYDPEGDWPDAPLLGLGFSLHLVRRLAAAAGGQLIVHPDWFTLRLPVAGEATDVGSG